MDYCITSGGTVFRPASYFVDCQAAATDVERFQCMVDLSEDPPVEECIFLDLSSI